MDKELLTAISSLLDEKLVPIKNDIQGMKTDIQGVKTDIQDLKVDMQGMKARIQSMETDMQGMKTDMQDMNADMQGMKTDIQDLKARQEESYQILKALEHSSEVNKAEHDKFSSDLAHISGQLEGMRRDLSTVEIVTARNMENIAQLKIIK